MKLLYLDDSGSESDNSVNYVVLGGVCVDESGVRWLSHELDELAKSIYPNNPAAIEFHASEIFQGKNDPWKSMSKGGRIETICRVLQVLKNAFDSTSVFAVAVEKRPTTRDSMLIAYEKVSQLFNNHLEHDSGVPDRGIIILDDTSYKTGLQDLAVEIRRTGNRKGSQNRSIIEIPMFVDSKASRIVQLADHIAYAVFRRYNAMDYKYYSEIEGRFIFKENLCYSLGHVTNNQDCTCPACLTRKSYEKTPGVSA